MYYTVDVSEQEAVAFFQQCEDSRISQFYAMLQTLIVGITKAIEAKDGQTNLEAESVTHAEEWLGSHLCLPLSVPGICCKPAKPLS
jgi:hypothetical protein